MCAQLAQGGVRIGNARFKEITGTMGCVVQSRARPEVRYVLTAAHVLNPGGYASRGDAVQAQINGQWQKIAELEDWTTLRDLSGRLHECDAAIARITAPDLVSPEIVGIGAPVGVASSAFQDKRLQLRGAFTAAVVEARVHSTGNQAPVYYEDPFDGDVFSLLYDKQILYGLPQGGWRPATQAGDSGALVLDNNLLAVGLHIARTDDAYPVQASVCTPLQLVLDTFEVDLVVDVAAAGSSASSPPVLSDDELSRRSTESFGISVMQQLVPHAVFAGVKWQLTAEGLVVDGRLEGTRGALVTVPRVWKEFGPEICDAAREFGVPVELIVATMCTESSGQRNVPTRVEPDGRRSVGLMQTLIDSAQEALPGEPIDEDALRLPRTSIRAGTACIHRKRTRTQLDPPLVACAYNAGDVYFDDGAANRWKLRQFPIGSGAHLDRFVPWFNDCFLHFSATPELVPTDVPSHWRLFRG
jgi:hypothetical protein